MPTDFASLSNESLQSYDATTHFETTVNDVIQMYTKITGKVRVFILLHFDTNIYYPVVHPKP